MAFPEGLSGDGGDDDSNSAIPDHVESGLRGLDGGEEDGLDIDESVRCNKFFLEYSSELPNGRGRDKFLRYIWRQLVAKDGRYIDSEDYDTEDVVDATVYLLDELDRNGSMLGGEVVEYLEEFVLEDGSPDYLEGFETI